MFSVKKIFFHDSVYMKFLFLIFSFLFITNAGAQEENNLLAQVKAKLDRVNDYQAKGRMVLDVSFIDAPPSQVIIFYKKPDRFRVKKNGGISILPKGGVSINMGSLLSDGNYDVVPSKDAVIDGITTKVLKLLPRDESGDVVLTTLYIQEDKQVIRKAVVNTKENGTYEIELTYGKYTSWGLPDKVVFSFNTKDYKLPKGITFEYDKGEKKKVAQAKDKKGKVTITYSEYVINKGVDDKVFEKS
jgi:outer membrane lipoprotein-sorting protein